jgi:hypothetical protein
VQMHNDAPNRVEPLLIQVSWQRCYFAWGLLLTLTALWTVAILAAGMHRRVLDSWQPAATMLFGSFLAGSSPECGGAGSLTSLS